MKKDKINPKEKEDVGEGKRGLRKLVGRVNPLIETITIGALLSFPGKVYGQQQIVPKETKTEVSICQGEVPKGEDLLPLMYANGFIADALSDPDNPNSVELGLAAQMYYAMAYSTDKANSPAGERLARYADQLLLQAIQIAKYYDNAYALLWLADLYDKYVTEQGRTLGLTSEGMRKTALGAIEEGRAKPCYILPSDYYHQERGIIPTESSEGTPGTSEKNKGSEMITPVIVPSELKPYEGPAPEGTDILALQYANGLIADAIKPNSPPSPMKLALAAQIYLAMALTVPEKNSPGAERLKRHALSILSQAANVAISTGNPCALMYIAGLYVLAGMPDRAAELRETARTMEVRSVDYLLPIDYYDP